MTKQDISQMVNTPETRRIVDFAKAFPLIEGESAALRMICKEWWQMKLMYPMALPLEAQGLPAEHDQHRCRLEAKTREE